MEIPETPQTLLDTLLRQGAQDEAHWARFDALYRPVIKNFIRQKAFGPTFDMDDLTQEVFIKLVDVLRKGVYQRDRGRFRCYLATIVRNIVIDHLRSKRLATVSIEDIPEETQLPAAEASGKLAEEELDRQWQEACYQAALKHVLNKTPLPAGHREIYLETLRDDDTASIAARHNVTPEAVRQIKHRIRERIAAHVKMLVENAR